jgi:acetyl esterase/lipase
MKKHSTHHLRNWLLGSLGVVLVLIALVIIWFSVSPWPGSMLIRQLFDKGGAKTAAALEKHLPSDVASVTNQQYRSGDPDAYLDVFYPGAASGPLPTVVWVHGGAWVSGNKDDTDNYVQILASRGFTTVSVNYSIAPEHKYPLPVVQVNEALGYLLANAERLHIDPSQIFLAGDSAGSQIVAQVANTVVDPVYAAEVGLRPELAPNQLKGLLLNCGAYDLKLASSQTGLGGWFVDMVLWAYSGKKDYAHDPKMRPASVYDYVNSSFPPSFITAGNADPLESQSREFARKLAKLGVSTSTLFYAADHQPELPHEYQFNLDIADGQTALVRMVAFLQSQINPVLGAAVGDQPALEALAKADQALNDFGRALDQGDTSRAVNFLAVVGEAYRQLLTRFPLLSAEEKKELALVCENQVALLEADVVALPEVNQIDILLVEASCRAMEDAAE